MIINKCKNNLKYESNKDDIVWDTNTNNSKKKKLYSHDLNDSEKMEYIDSINDRKKKAKKKKREKQRKPK